KPFDRPLNWSVTTVAETTVPDWVKNSRSPSLVVLKLRPPTKSFCAMEVTCRTSAFACASQERGRNCETASGEGGSKVSRCPDQTGRVYARRTAAVSSAGSVRSRMARTIGHPFRTTGHAIYGYRRHASAGCRARRSLRLMPGGRSAIDRAAEVLPDVMLIDLGLPDVEGHQVACRMRPGGAARARITGSRADRGPGSDGGEAPASMRAATWRPRRPNARR